MKYKVTGKIEKDGEKIRLDFVVDSTKEIFQVIRNKFGDCKILYTEFTPIDVSERAGEY